MAADFLEISLIFFWKLKSIITWSIFKWKISFTYRWNPLEKLDIPKTVYVFDKNKYIQTTKLVKHLKGPIADPKFLIFSSNDLPESIKTSLYCVFLQILWIKSILQIIFKKLKFWDFIGQFMFHCQEQPYIFAKNEFLDPKKPLFCRIGHQNWPRNGWKIIVEQKPEIWTSVQFVLFYIDKSICSLDPLKIASD